MKLIGSGSFGCVVSPPVETNVVKTYIKYSDKASSDVGKLFKSRDDAYEEFENELNNYLERSKEVSTYDKLTVKLKGANSASNIRDDETLRCLIDLDDDDYIEKQELKSYSKETFHQLIYEYGGQPLKELACKTIRSIKFLQMFRDLLNVYKDYQSAGYVHFDLNGGNILINEKKMSMIDFGFETKLKDVYVEDNIHRLSHKYWFYPPEFRLYRAHIRGYSPKDNKIRTQRVVDFSSDNILSLFKSSRFIKNSFDLFTERQIKCNVNSLWKTFDPNELDPTKIDIYAFGVNLYMYRRCIQFSSDEEKEDYNNLVRGLINPNYKKRFSIEKTLNVVDNLIKKYSTGGSKKNKKDLKLRYVKPKKNEKAEEGEIITYVIYTARHQNII